VNQNLKFYRIVNEMIGRCRIKRVEYGDGISALSKLQIAAGLSIRFTDVGIFNIITGERLHKEIAYELVPGTPENSHIVLGGVTKIDVEYKLPSTSVYRILMSSSGYDIIVGTKVRSTTDTIGNEGTEAVRSSKMPFKTPNYSIFNIGDLPNIMHGAVSTLLEEEAKFEANSSGWSRLIIDGLLICISKLTLL
ncbi:uncharacterized protein LOC120356407, partial [Nilaparvata lugens]|uniref:uncharacterized protein LOC120356407 n=1 Tax=Nilaparvata lugens TaxID=108931 RepID=UPI00193D625A